MGTECSLSQLSRLIVRNIVKPKTQVLGPLTCDVPTPKKEVFAQNIFYTCPKKLIFHGRKKDSYTVPKNFLNLSEKPNLPK